MAVFVKGASVAFGVLQDVEVMRLDGDFGEVGVGDGDEDVGDLRPVRGSEIGLEVVDVGSGKDNIFRRVRNVFDSLLVV